MIQYWFKQIRSLLPSHRRRELDEELHYHLDMATEANRAAGMSDLKARRAALVAFGGVEKIRAQTYEQRLTAMPEGLLQDVRYALRGFRRSPVFTLTLVITLMLGIGVTTEVFSVVDRILFRPLPYAHGERLVSFGLVQSLEPQEFMAGGFFYDWRDRQQPFETVAAESAVASECDLTESSPVQLSCVSADASFLPMLGIAPVLGRNFLPEEDRPNGPAVALITHELWTARYHADPDILNRPIHVDGKAVQVVGVLPRGFRMPSLHAADVISPMALDEAAQRQMSPGRPMRAFARLKPGVSVEQARASMGLLFEGRGCSSPLRSATTFICLSVRYATGRCKGFDQRHLFCSAPHRRCCSLRALI